MVKILMPTIKPDLTEETADVNERRAGIECETLVIVDEDHEGYTRTVNRGLAQSAGEDICIVIDDAVMSEGWLRILHDAVHEREALDVWFAGPSMDCRTPPQNSGRRGDRRRPRIVDHVCGGCLYAKSDAYESIGSFDERMVMYASEVDWQWRAYAKAGAKAIWVPEVWCEHEVHGPNFPEWWKNDHQILREKWGERRPVPLPR